MHLIANAPPAIDLVGNRLGFPENFKIISIYEDLKSKLINLANQRKRDLLKIGVDPIPIIESSNGNFVKRKIYDDPRSHYIKFKRFNGKQFMVGRVSEHDNHKFKGKEVTATFL